VNLGVGVGVTLRAHPPSNDTRPGKMLITTTKAIHFFIAFLSLDVPYCKLSQVRRVEAGRKLIALLGVVLLLPLAGSEYR
jgi:hypothetical protein